MTHPELVTVCMDYLTARRITLWGEYFCVTEEAGRLEAAEWLADQIQGVAELTALTNTATVEKQHGTVSPGAPGPGR